MNKYNLLVMLLGVECSLMHLLSSLNSIHFFQNAEVLKKNQLYAGIKLVKKAIVSRQYKGWSRTFELV
jgi:hypothetical protein